LRYLKPARPAPLFTALRVAGSILAVFERAAQRQKQSFFPMTANSGAGKRSSCPLLSIA